ncbi:hypothetical protein J6590_068969 [Homalodisca vitripennis]|nr:hypothetical protein J6590_068969 [Homalodisca vitripennis]
MLSLKAESKLLDSDISSGAKTTCLSNVEEYNEERLVIIHQLSHYHTNSYVLERHHGILPEQGSDL